CASILLFAPSLQTASQQREDIEKKINALLARMTLEEKLGQLQQLDGESNGNFRPEHRDLVRKGLLGSTLNVRGAQRTNELQRIAIEESRLKIPLLFGFDVIHGYRTILPVPLGDASSWDPAVAETSASIAAAEARSSGVHWTFAPMVDIARDARWGRIVEGSGEDSYLGASFARACAAFRGVTTAPQTRFSLAPSIGLRMARPRRGAITTPPICLKGLCVRFIFHHSKLRLIQGSVR